MLNELLVAERGLTRAGIKLTPRHKDIKDVRKGLPTLLVRLDAVGQVAAVCPVPAEAKPWTLGDGNHNRFPFVQPKTPFLSVATDHEARGVISGRDSVERRQTLLDLFETCQVRRDAVASVIGKKFLPRLNERGAMLFSDHASSAARRVGEAMRRFVLAVKDVENHGAFARSVASGVGDAMRDSADDLLADIAIGLLVGRVNNGEVVAAAGLLIDVADDESVEGSETPIWHPDVAAAVSDAMQAGSDDTPSNEDHRVCGLSGNTGPMLSGPFPNPNLPTLGPTFLFSRNDDTPSLSRYRRFDDTMPVGRVAADRLAATADELTEPHRNGKTWQKIPGERSKQTDLMLAYVSAAPNAPVAELVATEADFEQLTKEVIQAVKAKVEESGLQRTPVRFAVLRRVDPGNRKVIVSDSFSVQRLVDAADDWRQGRQLLPPGFTLPTPGQSRKLTDRSPPSVAPLGLISFTRPVFVRGGLDRTDAIGITAADALALFLATGKDAAHHAARILRLVLRRRTPLVVGCAHARRRGFDDIKQFDRLEVLRTVSVLCVLIHKLGHDKETDMPDSLAYKLGQLLAAADVIHAGYCADLRGGHLPPSLLGNQVFAMAQKSPTRALEMFCRRWKPYGAWAGPGRDTRSRAEGLVASKSKKDQQRGWDIRIALRYAREAKPLAAELAEPLGKIKPDDAYRAELLLGYLAGLPKREQEEESDQELENRTN